MKGTQFSVREAAERAGVSRQTMFRYIKDGRVSATNDRNGKKQIELTELLRAFGELQPETQATATVTDNPRQKRSDSTTANATPTYHLEMVKLQAQLEIKTAELELAKERISELKAAQHDAATEKNRFLEIIERQSLLLTAPSATVKPKKAAATAKPKKPTASKKR